MSHEPGPKVISIARPPTWSKVKCEMQLPGHKHPSDLERPLDIANQWNHIGEIGAAFIPEVLAEATYGSSLHRPFIITSGRKGRHVDLACFNMYDVLLTPESLQSVNEVSLRRLCTLTIQVFLPKIVHSGLAERKPSVLVHDRFLIRRTGAQDDKWYAEVVHRPLTGSNLKEFSIINVKDVFAIAELIVLKCFPVVVFTAVWVERDADDGPGHDYWTATTSITSWGGDIPQVGPVIRSGIARDMGFGLSYRQIVLMDSMVIYDLNYLRVITYVVSFPTFLDIYA
ncbi:uncharacterized protein LAESUDRAFT_813790 [Laetiporus sulphureus 93-53]|uniref:Uncharacterized protein n=1 Tax=Laetiporus sulphureus 93-53 TaxID=1314785 RepID=A0A165DHL2_9APHY|nr:uncharacterized protein LAESUDRAFT_813790 [Laetiporus sulphureus 93-53]KZT04896.1 hypothetical protein LAESUDRAFT_813790 [Laetiporus sulphureus 93-53]